MKKLLFGCVSLLIIFIVGTILLISYSKNITSGLMCFLGTLDAVIFMIDVTLWGYFGNEISEGESLNIFLTCEVCGKEKLYFKFRYNRNINNNNICKNCAKEYQLDTLKDVKYFLKDFKE